MPYTINEAANPTGVQLSASFEPADVVSRVTEMQNASLPALDNTIAPTNG